MFDNAVFDTLETTPHNRTWTTMASFALQGIGIGVLVLMPLIYTEALPKLRIAEAPSAPPAPRRPQAAEVVPVPATLRHASQFVEGALVEPRWIPKHAQYFNDPPPPAPGGDGIGVPYGLGTPDARQSAALRNILALNVAPAVAPTVVRPRPSVLLQGNLVRRIEPAYPAKARLARVQGPVLLAAVIDADGNIANLKVISGHPFLAEAALDAVRQWRYRPYVLNGVPIEVETQITVVFTLR
ncbi:MAG TPA: energy transducer TonB [Clostridia bacterium]|nr:energy transducer TonB [Clostridia bacterium]